MFAACAVCAFGFESVAKYKVSYSWFELGTAAAKLSIEGDRYVTEVSAKTKGMAATFTGNRAEVFRSEGAIANGVLVPEKYEWRLTSTKKTAYIGAFFDHNNSQVLRMSEKCDSSNKCEYESKILTGDEYAENDILSIYHNVTKNFLASGEKSIEVKAVGSRKKARVEIAEGKKLKEAQSILGKNGRFLLVFLNQDIFSSSDGALYVNLDDDAIVKKAVLADTILFGDVVGELTEKKITP
ncbi:hypothetical protein FACS189487_07110 [Campylobacterota bacterium]|nr:hypothetical protein FACS189487_07110 [Campylobacterota bacterium]